MLDPPAASANTPSVIATAPKLDEPQTLDAAVDAGQLAKNIAFKCIPSPYLAQCVKYYQGKALEDGDLVFLFENQLCQFKEPMSFTVAKRKAALV